MLSNAANSYSGGTTVIDNSILSIDDDHELGAAGGGLTLGDGTSAGQLAITGSLASAREITLGTSAAQSPRTPGSWRR